MTSARKTKKNSGTGLDHKVKSNFLDKSSLSRVKPLTENQQKAFEDYRAGDHLLLLGTAGTGKTFIGVYLALNDVLTGHLYSSVTLVRSGVQSRDMGFLPGNLTEKMELYENPYVSICSELFDRGDAYDVLKKSKTIEFLSTSFLRGTTFRNSVVVVDEVQNMNAMELHTVMTRVGENCRIIFCGDLRQSDLINTREKSGLRDFLTVVDRMQSFSHIEFTAEDIVRSGLVREYILKREELEDLELVERLNV